MNRRYEERIPTNLHVKLHCGNVVSYGTVKNISRNGMYINAKSAVPCESDCEVLIRFHDDVFRVPVKVNRFMKINHAEGGIGVELLKSTKKYLAFVDTLHFYYRIF